MDTITIEKFKKLVSLDSPKIEAPFGGRFGISMKSQKAQCKNLKVGETVFFLDATYRGLSKNNKPEVDIVIKQAMLVEERKEDAGDEASGWQC